MGDDSHGPGNGSRICNAAISLNSTHPDLSTTKHETFMEKMRGLLGRLPLARRGVGLRPLQERVVSRARPPVAPALADQSGGIPGCVEDPVAHGHLPTLQEVYDRLREEWEALGLLSFTGDGSGGWRADLDQNDIKEIRALLRDAIAAIEGYA